jgi:hypothetical protein
MLTNPDNELYKLELTLRNLYVSKDGTTTRAGEPLMNDVGVTSILGMTQSVVNQVTIMSNLSKNDVPALMEFLYDTLSRDLMISRVEYGITTNGARDKIFFSVLASAFICMKRAFEEGDKRFWKGSQQDITHRVEQGGGQKTSLLSKVLGWNK